MWQYKGDKRECPVYYARVDESNREEVHDHRKGSPCNSLCMQEVPTLFTQYHIIFHTDHDSLQYLLNKLDLSGRIARWILLLQEFNYEVVVKPGKANSNVDFLSRQRGQEAVEDISADFLDVFPKIGTSESEEVTVFHINGRSGLEFKEVVDYLME